MPTLSGNNNVKVLISTEADTSGVDKTERAISQLSNSTEENVSRLSARSAAITGAMIGAAQAVVSRGINMVTSSIGDAIHRVDTLNNASRVFENMGFSAQDANGMMKDLTKSILGLPTSLSDAVTGVELLTGSTQDINKSRLIFSALNDGIIGFGGSAWQVNGAIIQLSQAFSNGKVDAQTWNSLIQNGMGPALNALAKQMGLTTGQFKEGLSDGSISVGKFQDALIKLDKDGGGGLSSLQKIAHDATSGIGTGMENAHTAIVRGIAAIIQAVGSKNISEAISSIGVGFEKIAKMIASVIPGVIEHIKQAIEFLKQHHVALMAVVGIIGAFVIPAFVSLGISIVGAMLSLLPFIAVGALVGAVAQLIVTHLGGWHKVLDELRKLMDIALGTLHRWYDELGGIRGITQDVKNALMQLLDALGKIWDKLVGAVIPAFQSFHNWFMQLSPAAQALVNPLLAVSDHIHNLKQYFRDTAQEVENLWNKFRNSTAVTIITQFFRDVMVPALKSIWSTIQHDLMPALGQLWDAFTRIWKALQPALVDVLKVVAVILGGLLLAAIYIVLAGLNLLIHLFSISISVISDVIKWISTLIGWFGNLFGVIWNTINTEINIIRSLPAAFRDVVGLIGAIIGGVGSLILSPFRWAYDSVISLFRNLPHELGSIISGAFGNVGKAAKDTLHGLHIPGFATGVTNFGGGLALVGENGPELVNLPRGSNVYTNGQSRDMAGGGSISNQTNIYGNIHLADASAVQAFFDKIDQDTINTSRGLTANRGLR